MNQFGQTTVCLCVCWEGIAEATLFVCVCGNVHVWLIVSCLHQDLYYLCVVREQKMLCEILSLYKQICFQIEDALLPL